MKGIADAPVSICERMNHSCLRPLPISRNSHNQLAPGLATLFAILVTASSAAATPPRSAPAKESSPRLLAGLSKTTSTGPTKAGAPAGSPFGSPHGGSASVPGFEVPNLSAEPLEPDLDSLLAVPCGLVSLFGEGMRPPLAAELLGCNPDSFGGTVRLYGGNALPNATLAGDIGIGSGGLLLYTTSDHVETVRLIGSEFGNQGGQLLLKNRAGNTTVEIDGQEGQNDTAGALVRLKNNNGDVTIKLQSDANGEGVITTQVLTITGGSDLSEKFEVRPASDPEAAPRPGMLVSIDPSRPGELRVADRPRDTTVAGIISGAGGIQPGLLMGQSGSLADGHHPVALSGRVYCYADATFGAIRPGDLLTTSSKAGHAMRTTASEAAGAVIGKAMTPLESGQGLVLVLVNLQ